MKSLDLIKQKMDEARQKFQQALADNDRDALSKALQQMMVLNAEQVIVPAEDDTTTKTYTVTVNKGA